VSCTAGLSALFTPRLLFVVSPGQQVGYSIFSPASLQLHVYIFVLQEEEETEAEWKGQITPCTPLPEGTHRDCF